MKIKVKDAIELLPALDEIRGQKTSKQNAKDIFFLRKKAIEIIDFFQEQQKTIIERMNLSVDKENRIDFKNDVQLFEQYKHEIDELRDVEVETNLDVIDLSNEDITFSAAFIEATEGYIKLF